MTTKPAPRTVAVGWARFATRDHRCAFVKGDVTRDQSAVVFFTGGDTEEASRYVGRLDDGREPAATMADNGAVRLFEASQPWTTATSGVLDVERLIGSARRLGPEDRRQAWHHYTCTIAALPPLKNVPDARGSGNLSWAHREGT